MKSEVILFCVLIFCSKIVDSVPHPEDHVRQRVNPPSNWQVNQNAPNAQYLDTDFIETRNGNIQQEKIQDYNSNQGRYNYNSNGYSRSPASSPSGEHLLVSYDSSADGRRLDSYPPKVESYTSRTSQVGFDNQQYQNQNWRSQSQYTNSAPSAVRITDDERPLVTTVQEPYRSSGQYLQPKYVRPSNRRFYQPGRSYLTREQFIALTGDSKYVANSAPRFGSSDPVPYENYSEDQVAASKIKARPPGGRRYVQSFAPQPRINYNEVPVVIATETLKDQTENIKYVENYNSGSDLSNTASITNHDDRPLLISETDHNSDSIPNDLAHVNTNNPVVFSKKLSEKLQARRYANNYKADSGWREMDIARDDSSNGAPVVTETVEVKSGKYEANYESDYGSQEPVPINTYSGAPSAPADTELVNSGSNKHEESNVAHHGSSSPTTLNTNPNQNVYHKLTSGITEINLKDLVANPEIENMLAGTNKRYVVVHPNGTVEYLDKLDIDSRQNSKLRLVHHKRKNINDTDSDGVFTQHLPENLLNDITETPVPVDTNNQPADDKKPTPLHVDQVNPGDEYDSKLSPPLKDQPENRSNLKPLPQPEKQPADNNNPKRLPSYLISPADDDNSTLLTSNEDQSAQNVNLKHLPQDVNQLRDDDDLKPLTPHVNQSAVDGNSKPLPQDGNQTADQTNLPSDDDNLKLLTSKEDQPADDVYSKLDQSKDENNFTPLFSNERQPAQVKKLKVSSVKHPEDDKNSKALPKNENQPHDDEPFHPHRRQPAHHNKSKHLHVKQPADNNNSNPSSSGENQPASDKNVWPLNEDQLRGETDSTSLHPHKKQPVHRYKSKPKHSHNQPIDDNPLNTSKLLTYPENQPGDAKNSNPSSPDENEPENNDNSKPLPSNVHQSGDETDFTSLPSHKKQPSYHYKSKSRHSHDQLDDANNSNSSSPGDDQTGDDNTSKPLPSNKNQSGDDNDSKPLPANATQSVNNTKSQPSHGDEASDENNSNPSSPDENQPEEYKKSKPLSPNENQPTDDLKTKPSSVASKNDGQSNSTTVSSTVPNYTTSSKPQVINTHTRKHIHRKSTTNSPVVSTTPCPEDQIITISPIEQTTDNVSDVPPATTTTTKTRPFKTPGKSDIINDANNTDKDDIAQTYSTTTVSPSTSTLPTDNISDDKTIQTKENKNTQTKDKTVIDQVNNWKKDTQTAVYNSSELFDTNTDVPAESDDYSSLTASSSVQNDVNTGDAFGDNSLELEQSQTDVTITVSSSTANDSEDEITSINIEVWESADNADTSSNDKSLVVSIDTNDGSDDESITPKPEDCKKDLNSDDGKGKNLGIDMANLKEKPTMWIRTTNQDFIDKLTSKNETEFDLIYFFHIDNQPTIEREKTTTIYCNGTVVTENTEITYAHKDDPTPTIVKTTTIQHIGDYKADVL